MIYKLIILLAKSAHAIQHFKHNDVTRFKLFRTFQQNGARHICHLYLWLNWNFVGTFSIKPFAATGPIYWHRIAFRWFWLNPPPPPPTFQSIDHCCMELSIPFFLHCLDIFFVDQLNVMIKGERTRILHLTVLFCIAWDCIRISSY